ncbi:hypothetical protein GUITHDRAFT_102620 [Guillardia theta CCMP2712]|uniref:Uncharacterized protein n=1 Tax=Guillardia theta (strain CCMP2712) TaxID=905079 RepID=L1JUX0_GUITC|nr:hypothetical protein GUITHDRAFT_102620 [Guillardia theta CCMP2712]EKX52005.1 hypothetical protein GUITHDRAFT_102620 [Guillardia theta CCMP2712]|eukprot:XP_005838985.1 hypothetical protein GUITHDRAFT_102620 [Guillardia theta CCMP2712]
MTSEAGLQRLRILRGGKGKDASDQPSSESKPSGQEMQEVERLLQEYEAIKERWMVGAYIIFLVPSGDEAEENQDSSDMEEAQQFVQESHTLDARLNKELKDTVTELQDIVTKEQRLDEELRRFEDFELQNKRIGDKCS